jgi:hypothetical protein
VCAVALFGVRSNNRWGVRERLVVTRRGRGKTVCARGANVALLGGPSTSPLEGSLCL